MLHNGRSWNADLSSNLFTETDAASIMQMPISKVGAKDKLIWIHSPNGQYTVNSCYQWLSKWKHQTRQQPEGSGTQEQECAMWKRLWKLRIKGKIKHILWKIYHHHLLPTGANLKRKGIEVDERCKICCEGAETIENLFFQCKKVQIIWKLSPIQWEGIANNY